MTEKYQKKKLPDGTTMDMHRYVWQTERGDIPAGRIVHHIDRDKSNSSIANLACITRSEHARVHGVVPPDGRESEFKPGNIPANRTALGDEQAAEIYRLARNRVRLRALAEEFDVPLHVVKDISCGRTFGAVTTPSA